MRATTLNLDVVTATWTHPTVKLGTTLGFDHTMDTSTPNPKMPKIDRTVCWFSCGAASAYATKLALEKYDNCIVAYQDTGAEHPDNERFLVDCEKWFGQKIIVLKSQKYSDIWEVFEKTKWLVGPSGARCTGEMKRKVAEDFINFFRDREVFGYTSDEWKRLERFKSQNEERIIDCPLVDAGKTKADCFKALSHAGIELPTMYRMGYRNNNCIGCVKGQSGYWNKIRVDFPEVFERMSKVERKLNAAINKKYVNGKRIRVFLDELPRDAGRYEAEPSISCGLFCGANQLELNLETKPKDA